MERDRRFSIPDAELGRTQTVAICRDPIEAEIAQDLLDAAGIPYLVTGENASTLFGGLIGQRILVPVAQSGEAVRVLQAEGLALDGDGPSYDAARERVARVEAEETSRLGMRPIVYFLVMLLASAVLVLLRSNR